MEAVKGSLEEFELLIMNGRTFVVTDIVKTKRGYRIVTDEFPGKYFPVKPAPIFEKMYADFMEGIEIAVIIDDDPNASSPFVRKEVTK